MVSSERYADVKNHVLKYLDSLLPDACTGNRARAVVSISHSSQVAWKDAAARAPLKISFIRAIYQIKRELDCELRNSAVPDSP